MPWPKPQSRPACAARQKGEKTLKGSPALLRTVQGSDSRPLLKLWAATPSALSAAFSAASRSVTPGS